jgi:hypothetical protein
LSDFDAYEDMKRASTPTDREIERVLSGRFDGDETLAELATFVSDVRKAYGAPPDASVAQRHLALISAAAAEQATETGEAGATDAQNASSKPRRTFMPSRKRIARAAIVFALVGGMVTGSLAAAGINVPILPSQASDEAEDAVARAAERGDQRRESGAQAEQGPPAFAEELRALLESVPPGERGCAFGQRVATIASGEDPTQSDPCAARNAGNGNGRGRENAAGNLSEQSTGGRGAGHQGDPGGGGRETGNQASGGVASQAQVGGVESGPGIGSQASGGVGGQAQSGGVQGGRNVGEQASGGVSAGAAAAAPQAGGSGGGGQGPPVSLPPAAQHGQGAAANASAGPGKP